jgi:hypothetical protein
MFFILLGYSPHRISQKDIETLRDIEDWYMGKYYTHVRIYGSYEAPHLLPKYVPDRLLSVEATYQTIGIGITSFLSVNNKKLWPSSQKDNFKDGNLSQIVETLVNLTSP